MKTSVIKSFWASVKGVSFFLLCWSFILGGVGCWTTQLGRHIQFNRAKRKEKAEEKIKKAANEKQKLEDIQEGLRNFNGRIEEIEKKLQSLEQKQKDNRTQIELNQDLTRDQFKNHLEVLKNLELEILNSKQQILLLSQKMNQSRNKATRKKSQKISYPFSLGEKHFKRKKWAEAIKHYEIYRKRYPEGRNYVEATYKMGLSFWNLNLKKEALAFFTEIVESFPRSRQSKKARVYLSK